MSGSRVIVAGCGPAGIMAAGRAAARGLEVILLEKMPKPARKLGLTGKGRCNLTNSAELAEFLARFGPQGKFLRPALQSFSNQDLRDFLQQLGVETLQERGGRIFPAAHSAPQLARILVAWAKEQGARLMTGTSLQDILLQEGRLQGALLQQEGAQGSRRFEMPAASLVLATGGACYPATGSSGEGQRLAQGLGHTVSPLRPALVPLQTKGQLAPRLQGLSLRNVQASLYVQGKRKAKEFGELVFTHFGVSGPIVLSLSRQVAGDLEQGRQVSLVLDLKPAVSQDQLQARISRVLQQRGRQGMKQVLKEFLPPKMIQPCLEQTGISPEQKASQVDAGQQKRLRLWLKELCLEVQACRPLEEAIITAGGVSLREVDPRSMASRLVPGLYLAGEILDLDADTGGFNLQAAFSTGWLAGESVDPGGL
ncbi:MAG: NAD(P)/FAD-dependent oxidoreductase [Desulfohalobiaceae bacterium]